MVYRKFLCVYLRKSTQNLVGAAWEVNALIAITRRSLQRFLPSTMSCSWLIAAKERPHFGHHVGTAAAHLPFSQLQNNIVNILVEISNAVLTLFHVGKFTVAPPERGPRLLYFFYFPTLKSNNKMAASAKKCMLLKSIPAAQQWHCFLVQALFLPV